MLDRILSSIRSSGDKKPRTPAVSVGCSAVVRGVSVVVLDINKVDEDVMVTVLSNVTGEVVEVLIDELSEVTYEDIN